MSAPKPQPGILDITPYQGGKSKAEGTRTVAKLSSNETPLGASPKAVEAFTAVAGQLHRYPDGGASDLRDALADHYGLKAENIVCGNGSDEILSLVVQAYAGEGDEVLYSRHGFLMYPLAAKANGAIPVQAEETDLTADVDKFLAAVTDRTRVVFLANPNNPTGTYLPEGEVRRLRDGLPDEVLLVIDAAYAEYVSRNDYTSGMALVEEFDNVLMTRTFSKIYGLAALRIGWAYGSPEVIDVLNRLRGPFNTNMAAQAAAVAGLRDVAHTDAARAHNDVWLPRLTDALRGLGLEVTPSVGNFILIHFPGGEKSAEAADGHLTARGLLLRAMTGYGFAQALRMSIGRDEENEAVIAALNEFMG